MQHDDARDTSNYLMITRGGMTPFSGDYNKAKDRVVFGRFIPAGPVALNLVTDGHCPRGREVQTPHVLRHLPMRPPGR